MGKKRKLLKEIHKRELDDTQALVICTGKNCCARQESCAVAEAARLYADNAHLHTQVVTVGCLGVCKKGPIAATYPTLKFKKHVTVERAQKMLDKLERRRG